MRTTDELADEIASLAAHLDAATGRLLCCIREFDGQGGWERQGAIPCAHWLSWRIGVDLPTAREKVRVARALGKLPSLERALGRGELSYSKVRALTRVATPENEERLLELARQTTGAQLEKICRSYRQVAASLMDEGSMAEERSVRERLLPGGMVRIEMTLHPDEAALVLEAIEKARASLRERRKSGSSPGSNPGLPPPPTGSAETPGRAEMDTRSPTGTVDTMPGEIGARGGDDHVSGEASAEIGALGGDDHVSGEASAEIGGLGGDDHVSGEAPAVSIADAAVHMAETFLAHRQFQEHGAAGAPLGNGADRYQVFVHLDDDPIGAEGNWAATLDDGTRLPAETLRRIACDSGLVATRTDASGSVLDVGRRTRSIPPAIRRALWLRDRGCRFPGCGHTRFLHGHHLRHWMAGGETKLDNLLLLCTRHHRLLHEGGCTVHHAEDGTGLVFGTAEGRGLPALPAIQVVEDAQEELHAWAAERRIEIGPDTNLPWWDGSAPDYDWIISSLDPGSVTGTQAARVRQA